MKKVLILGVAFCLALAGCKSATAPKNPPTIIGFYAIPDAVEPGESTTLSWSTMYADSVSIDHGIGRVAASGSTDFWPGETSTLTLTASNADGSDSAQVLVTMKSVARMVLSGTPNKKMKSYGCPYFTGYVKNEGNATGYNVMIEFHAYSDTGRKTIIDTASGFPADLGNINPGQRASFEAVFFDLSNWDQVKAWDYEITWLNVNFGPGAIRVKATGVGF